MYRCRQFGVKYGFGFLFEECLALQVAIAAQTQQLRMFNLTKYKTDD
ncbi:hypothetical protein [Pontibacter cellulosilyticus]|uniref:Uncharacterized protein n=1 Tax=Pontibacter cellulosilyticus TaxID=1720253 RepID=A0A923SH93_9BACT|nr:hypothetical protein [Pontibacter cellulosilyticus]MBC5991312.1 hypothetical protein [Pontibacter cellulosilyticus]